jgi:hypothetical protein
VEPQRPLNELPAGLGGVFPPFVFGQTTTRGHAASPVAFRMAAAMICAALL